MPSRQARPARAGSSPRTATSPPSRRRMPSRISTVVVLPAPLGPSSAKTSPPRTSRSRPSTTVRCPYRLTRPRTRTAGSSCDAGAVGPGAGAVVCMPRHFRRPRGRGTTEALVLPSTDRWTPVPTVTSGNRQWTSVGTGRLRVVDLEFERCYRAVAGRDARFDGWFFTAVHTTGIYCRPSCPARTPLARNVTFFTTAAAAQAAGFRACRRCRPDAAPGSPEWDVRADVVARAMRLIADGEVERAGVPGLAARLGYSERQLHRLLVGELGVGVLALARARRAQTARVLIETTELPMSEVAFAAGFASIRQFNHTVREVFATTPTGLRRARRRGRDGAPPGWLTLRLTARAPYDAAEVLLFLGAHAVPGLEEWDGTTFSRVLDLPHGPAVVQLTPTTDGGPAVFARLHLTELRDLGTAVSRCRRMLDLDADPAAVDDVLGADPALAP